MKDSLEVSTAFSFYIDVICLNSIETEEKIDLKKFDLPPPKPYIDFMDAIGLVRVGFTRPILIPSYSLFPNFKNPD